MGLVSVASKKSQSLGDNTNLGQPPSGARSKHRYVPREEDSIPAPPRTPRSYGNPLVRGIHHEAFRCMRTGSVPRRPNSLKSG